MTAIFIAAMVLGGLVWWLTQQRRPQRRLRVAVGRQRSPAAATATPAHLLKRLDRLTKDRRVSERLIERLEFNHPGRSKRWYIEKAIYDIQRDRRS